MKMKTGTRTKKLFAALTSLLVAAGSTVPMAVDAATIPDITTDFEYELAVTKVEDGDLQLTFYTTYNPGVSKLGLAMVFDTDRFTGVKRTLGDELMELSAEGQFIDSYAINNDNGVLFMGMLFNKNKVDQDDYTGQIEITFHLEAKDGDAEDEAITGFGAAVAEYGSIAEDISVNRIPGAGGYDPETLPPEIELDTVQSFNYSYYRGDVDASSTFTLDDVVKVNSLVSLIEAENKSNYVSAINDLLMSGETYTYDNGNTTTWSAMFSNFIRTYNNVTFSCVECADANADNYVTTDDSQVIINNYSMVGSGTPVEELLEEAIKVVYY